MEKVEMISRACEFLLSKRSCRNVTMDEVASDLGISKRTLYENFENKGQLILECMEFMHNNIFDKCNKIESKCENAFDFFMSIVSLMWSISGEMFTFTSELKRVYPEIYKQVLTSHIQFARAKVNQFLVNAKKEGFVKKDIDEEFFLNLIELNMIYSSHPDFLKKNSKYTEKELKFKLLCTIMRGISSVEGVQYMDNKVDKWNKIIKNNL